MADNYSQTSFLVECGSAELAKELVAAHEKFEQEDGDDEGNGGRTYLWATVQGESVWFSDRDACCCLNADWFNFLSDWLWHKSLDTVVEITWAETCSKPRVGQFSGGSAVVSRNGWEIEPSETALERLKKSLSALQERKGELR